MVHFVGAGSGAVDLITVRGAKLLGECDVVIYAGSLVNPALLDYCKPDCAVYNSAEMTLEQVIAETVKQDNQQREKDFLAQLFDAPCVTKCLEHLTPPRPFLLLLRSSFSQIQRTQKPSRSASW